MKIDRHTPQDPVLATIIDSYYAIESDGYIELQTIPNGRIDAVVVLEGELEWYFPEENCFRPLPAMSFYPATLHANKARVQNRFRCINIKFYPHVLNIDGACSFEQIFQTPGRDEVLMNNLRNASPQQVVELLDQYFEEQFLVGATGSTASKDILTSLENENNAGLPVKDIAGELGISAKTLARRFCKDVGITPKAFSKIRQLQRTVRNVQNINGAPKHGDLSEHLGNYYDQAHFIKSCRQLTGLSPRELFTALAPRMSDVVVVKRKGN